MEDNPMLVAQRAPPATIVQNPTFEFQQSAVVYVVSVEDVADPTYSGYATLAPDPTYAIVL